MINDEPVSNYSTLSALIYDPMFVFCGLLSATRIWLLYYDIHLSKLKMQRVWLNAIDPAIEENNWFKKYQHNLGNSTFLIRILLGITLVFIITRASVRMSTNAILFFFVMSIDYMLIIIVTIWYVVLVFRLRKCYYDNLGIKKELYIGLMSSGGIIIFNIVVYLCYGYNLFNQYVREQAFEYFQVIICCLYVWMLTILPKILINQEEPNKKSCRKYYNCRCFNASDIAKPGTTANTTGLANTKDANQDYRWQDIVSTVFGFECLMNHLEKEFSIENLLFIFEYVQIKLVLLNKFENEMNKIMAKNSRTRYSIKLPKISSRFNSVNVSESCDTGDEISVNYGSERESVPMSTIAFNLQAKLNDLQFNYKFENAYETGTVNENIKLNNDAILELGDSILDSFVQLHSK